MFRSPVIVDFFSFSFLLDLFVEWQHFFYPFHFFFHSILNGRFLIIEYFLDFIHVIGCFSFRKLKPAMIDHVNAKQLWRKIHGRSSLKLLLHIFIIIIIIFCLLFGSSFCLFPLIPAPHGEELYCYSVYYYHFFLSFPHCLLVQIYIFLFFFLRMSVGFVTNTKKKQLLCLFCWLLKTNETRHSRVNNISFWKQKQQTFFVCGFILFFCRWFQKWPIYVLFIQFFHFFLNWVPSPSTHCFTIP